MLESRGRSFLFGNNIMLPTTFERDANSANYPTRGDIVEALTPARPSRPHASVGLRVQAASRGYYPVHIWPAPAASCRGVRPALSVAQRQQQGLHNEARSLAAPCSTFRALWLRPLLQPPAMSSILSAMIVMPFPKTRHRTYHSSFQSCYCLTQPP